MALPRPYRQPADQPSVASMSSTAVPDRLWQTALIGPAREMLARPGKRLRTRLVAAGWAVAGGSGQPDPAISEVLELIHCGSLIVDDVEDGSSERRGGPALHTMVGVPLAINTGSWMYFEALDRLAALAIPGALERAVAALARCHEGQALDLAVRIGELDPREAPGVVAATTQLKTGALCRLAVELGALAGLARERIALADAVPRADLIGGFGEHAGNALQMLDDLGSVCAPARRAKGLEDLVERRPTWPWAWLARDRFAWARGVDQVAHGHYDAALATLATVEPIGRLAIRREITSALERIESAPPLVIERVAGELAAMETMYG